jgi:YidC/Oxa1 family membrane protein insertase
MTDSKNTILAIILSALVLIAWQYFIGMPQEKARQEQLQAQQQAKQPPQLPAQTGAPTTTPQAGPAQVPGQAPQPVIPATISRSGVLAASPRVKIATDSLQGSVSLKGGRIDDLALVKFRETVDPKSPPIRSTPTSAGPTRRAPL